jgi:hypothetical protein
MFDRESFLSLLFHLVKVAHENVGEKKGKILLLPACTAANNGGGHPRSVIGNNLRFWSSNKENRKCQIRFTTPTDILALQQINSSKSHVSRILPRASGPLILFAGK